MNQITIKKSSLIRFLQLIFSIGYGAYIVFYLNKHYILDSGDIMSLVMNSDAFQSLDSIFGYYGTIISILLSGDAVFRVVVFLLSDFLNQTSIGVLGILAFIISSTTFFIYCINIGQRKYLFFVLLLFLMVFFTPRVINLFASGVRSGMAFMFLLVALVYLKGLKQHLFMLFSLLIHLSMAPIIGFYFLYNWIDKQRIRLSFGVYLLILLLSSLIIAIVSPQLNLTNSPINQSILYMSLVAYLALLMIFVNKKVVRNVYGFISLGLILVVLLGYSNEFSFIRYIGNAIIFYLLFILKEGSPRTLHLFTIGYMPFFLVTLYYSISNYW